jgi:PAS domain S-box-containing protein
VYLYDRAYIARDPSGSARRVIGAMQDLTERRRAEAELRESEERFRNIANSAPVIVWVCDPDGLLTFTNRFGLSFVGRTMEQDLGTLWTNSLHPDDSERVASEFSSAIAGRSMYQLSFRLRRADGEYRWMLAKGAPRFAGDVYTGHIGITTDITELKQGQEQLQAAQKLESLGVLAGGIAHDFNNVLGGILAETELVEADLPAGSEFREEIQRIKTAAIRGSEIVRELMIYAGESQKDLNEAVDVPRLVEEMLKLLRVSISKQVTLRTDFPGDLPNVWGNAPRLRQVMMNLVHNASEAIGDAEGVINRHE